MIVLEQQWVMPSDLKPGEGIRVHMGWEPNDCFNEWFAIPPPPQDLVCGSYRVTPYWPPVSGPPGPYLTRMFPAIVELFQEKEGCVVVVTEDGRRWEIPHELAMVVARD